MKKMLFLAALLSSTVAMADGHYAGIRMETRDGREGAADSTAVGFTFGKRLTETVAAEFYTRTKFDEGQDANNTRIEGAVLTRLPLAGDLSWYTRSAIGQKFVTGDQYAYWSFEPGLRYQLYKSWSIKTGLRFRDSFDTRFDESTRTYRAAVEYAVNAATSVSVGVDRHKGEIEQNSLGIGLTHRF